MPIKRNVHYRIFIETIAGGMEVSSKSLDGALVYLDSIRESVINKPVIEERYEVSEKIEFEW